MLNVNAASPASGSPHRNETSALMLSELRKVHEDLHLAMAVMDSVTRGMSADRNDYSTARWRLSQASLKRRTLWARIFEQLATRVGPRDAADLQSLQETNLEMLRASAAHVCKWTIDAIESDWPDYCEASRGIRWKMKAGMGAEKRVLYPLLTTDALGGSRR